MIRIRSAKILRLAFLSLCSVVLCGCAHLGGYLNFWGQQRDLEAAIKEEPSAELLRQLEPDCYLLLGKVVPGKDRQRPILVTVVSNVAKKPEIIATKVLSPPIERYQIYLPEGTYTLHFFCDLDGNGFFETEEMVGQSSAAPITISKDVVRDGLTVSGPTLALDLLNPSSAPLPVKIAVREHSYVYASLQDDFFAKKYGEMGLYDPLAFLAKTQRFLFSLEKFDAKKTLVVFVHGIGGTPQGFEYLVEGLDRSRYQPWFFYYPSGMPVEKLGSLLAYLLQFADQTKTFASNRVIVVAHSSGGLVALSALEQLSADGVPAYIKGYISFSVPYGGVASVQTALDHAPAIVPVWRDMAPGSTFLEHLYRGRAKLKLPFYLFFGYIPGASGDGTIDLDSQLEARIHLTVTQNYGFKVTHVGILSDEGVRENFNRVLDTLDR